MPLGEWMRRLRFLFRREQHTVELEEEMRLHVELRAEANRARGPRISTKASRVSAWVLPTNEELMIARHTQRLVAAPAYAQR